MENLDVPRSKADAGAAQDCFAAHSRFISIVGIILIYIFDMLIIEILWNHLDITVCTYSNGALVALIGKNRRISKAVRNLLSLQI